MKNRNKKITSTVFGIFAALIAYSVIGKLGLYLLQVSWADYAVHSKDKSYTVEMLLCRLLIGVSAAVIAGIAAAKIEGGKGKAVWFAGVIIFCIASYIHCMEVWRDYPVWYHLAYLLCIIPVTGLGHYTFRRAVTIVS